MTGTESGADDGNRTRILSLGRHSQPSAAGQLSANCAPLMAGCDRCWPRRGARGRARAKPRMVLRFATDRD